MGHTPTITRDIRTALRRFTTNDGEVSERVVGLFDPIEKADARRIAAEETHAALVAAADEALAAEMQAIAVDAGNAYEELRLGLICATSAFGFGSVAAVAKALHQPDGPDGETVGNQATWRAWVSAAMLTDGRKILADHAAEFAAVVARLATLDAEA